MAKGKAANIQLSSVITERFGFALPATYTRMTEAGLFAANGRGRKAAGPPPALAASDLEWLGPAEIVARLERYRGGRASDSVFVPFAMNGEGEWGWAPGLGEPGANEAPIVFVENESRLARVVAPTFATFVFRKILETLVECPHDVSEMTLTERATLLRASARRVLDFLPAELSVRLDRALDRPIRKVIVRTLREKDGKFFRAGERIHLSVVSSEWAARVVREELEDAKVDEVVRFEA